MPSPHYETGSTLTSQDPSTFNMTFQDDAILGCYVSYLKNRVVVAGLKWRAFLLGMFRREARRLSFKPYSGGSDSIPHFLLRFTRTYLTLPSGCLTFVSVNQSPGPVRKVSKLCHA